MCVGEIVDSSMKGYLVTGLLGLCLLLGMLGQFGSSWLTETDSETEGVEVEQSFGLRAQYTEMTCDKDMEAACEMTNSMYQAAANTTDYMEYDDGVVTMDIPEMHDDCVKDMEDAGETSNEMCDTLGELVSAGTWGGITLWMGSLACIVCLLVFYLPMLGVDLDALPDNVAEVMTWSAGILTGLAVLIWYVLLPEGGDASAGLSVWLTITGALVGIGAGASNTFIPTDEL